MTDNEHEPGTDRVAERDRVDEQVEDSPQPTLVTGGATSRGASLDPWPIWQAIRDWFARVLHQLAAHERLIGVAGALVAIVFSGVLATLLTAGGVLLAWRSNVFNVEADTRTTLRAQLERRTELVDYLFAETCDGDSCTPTANARIRSEAAAEFVSLERDRIAHEPAPPRLSTLHQTEEILTAGLKRDFKRRVDLTRARLDGVTIFLEDFGEVNLGGVLAVGSAWARVTLEDAVLSGADLSGAYVWASHLERAKIEEADVSDATFVATSLEGASFRFSDLRGADFKRSSLTGVDLTGAYYSNGSCPQHRETRWPDGFDPSDPKHGMQLVPCDAPDAPDTWIPGPWGLREDLTMEVD